MKIISVFIGFFIVVFLTTTSFLFADQTLLTPIENTWLDMHRRTVVVRPQESNPPYVFAGSGSAKEAKGFSVEYIRAIAKKLGIIVSFETPAPLEQILAGARDRSDGVILSLTPTSEREQYLYFTESYYTAPAVIAVRKDFIAKKSVITLSDFENKKVAVGDTYAVQSYIQTNYPKVQIVSVADDQIGLQKLLLGEVDAVVMDLSALSYYTSNDVLSYIKIAGRTGFEYQHSIAVPKSSPELVLILNKGLESISEAERQVLINKWIQVVPTENDFRSEDVSNISVGTLKIWLIFVGFIILIAATIIIVLLLRRRPSSSLLRKVTLREEVQSELEDLAEAREHLKDDMAQIAEIEKDLKDKIGS